MRRAAQVAVAIVILTVFLSPLHRELYVGDETKYSQVVREMRAGSFFLPTLHGTPFTHKPPLHFWAIDLLTRLFGVYSIWPFVLPSLAAFVALLWMMARIGGPWAAFICGTSLLIWASAQTARMDVAFAGLLALSAWLIQRWFNGEKTLVAAAAAAGVAFLVKGPMAPVIFIALIAIEGIRRRRLPPGNYALAIGVLLFIPLLWLVPAVLIGGEAFWREIFYKQTVGRAVGAWVHKSPPWFYLVRAPLTLMPWFFLTIAAIVAAFKRRDEEAEFAVSWLLAVLIPYTLLSSKLDVYMITLLPAVGYLIARFVTTEDHLTIWGRRANLTMLTLFILVGVAGLFVQPHHIKGEDAELVTRLDVRLLFWILLTAALAAVVTTLRGRLTTSTLATGFVLVAALSWVSVALVPMANELASTRPLVRALERQNVPPERIGLFVVPHLWVRGMPDALADARHMSPDELRAEQPELIVTRRRDASKIEDVLQGYRRVDELQMIGKWFDVHRR
ncbi:MAG TPA: glycosyltransferase family 39 protein [Thermoanaerobaculia bacterium]